MMEPITITIGQAIVDSHEASIISELCELAERIDAAIHAEREACAKIAEQIAADYLSPEYATGQPLSSLQERLACESIANAIRARNAT